MSKTNNMFGSNIGDKFAISVTAENAKGAFSPHFVQKDGLNLPPSRSYRIYETVGAKLHLKAGDMVDLEIVGAEITDTTKDGATVIMVKVRMAGKKLSRSYSYDNINGTVTESTFCGKNLLNKETRTAVTKAHLVQTSGKATSLKVDIYWDDNVVAAIERGIRGHQGILGEKMTQALAGKTFTVTVGSKGFGQQSPSKKENHNRPTAAA